MQTPLGLYAYRTCVASGVDDPYTHAYDNLAVTNNC